MKLETTDIINICAEIANIYKKKMEQADYNPAGELMNFQWYTEYNNNTWILWFRLPEYWYYAENGRGPGKFPPPEAILKWVEFKRLVPSTRGKAISTKQLVYLISRKIAREGTQGKHLLEQTIEEAYNTLVIQLAILIANELQKEIENDLENL